MTTFARARKPAPMADLAAIVLCAGKGTRMKSEVAKGLHEVLFRPVFHYPVLRALNVGASPVVVVVGYQGPQVKAALERSLSGRPLSFVTQAEQRGTADAVRVAREALRSFAGPVLIVNGDSPLLTEEALERLLAEHRRSRALVTLTTTFPPDPAGYGRVVRKGKRVDRVVEEKDASASERRLGEINAGVYVAESGFLWKALEKVGTKNAQREFYLTDLVALGAKAGKAASVVAPFEEVSGLNDRAELAFCTRVLRERKNLTLMREGVTLVDPATTFVALDVEVGPDSELGPGVSLLPGCRLGKRVRVGQGSILSLARVGDGTRVLPYSVVEEADLGDDCQVGPFARLRPGTRLAEGVHIGNFVETKKAEVGKGSKANHLTYLGDAVLGAGVNVGAGTITCNYDGQNKHRTVLGDRVFVGSDTQLVAPVTVGEGAYIGAGTTVTRDVPPYSLSLSRPEQIIKDGWAKRKKSGAGNP